MHLRGGILILPGWTFSGRNTCGINKLLRLVLGEVGVVPEEVVLSVSSVLGGSPDSWEGFFLGSGDRIVAAPATEEVVVGVFEPIFDVSRPPG